MLLSLGCSFSFCRILRQHRSSPPLDVFFRFLLDIKLAFFVKLNTHQKLQPPAVHHLVYYHHHHLSACHGSVQV
jgi:hypothetical protein